VGVWVEIGARDGVGGGRVMVKGGGISITADGELIVEQPATKMSVRVDRIRVDLMALVSEAVDFIPQF
jgi:hypothetical protein